MGDGEGLDVSGRRRTRRILLLSVVFLTAFATIELAVESMRRGAFDFITKPFVAGSPARVRWPAQWSTPDCLRENVQAP